MHIYGHSWPVRWGDEGEARLVKVYSNCNTVELYVNGQSLGLKEGNVEVYPACGLFWNVRFSAGENSLMALATQKKVMVRDTIVLTYQTDKWTEPVRLDLTESIIDAHYSWIKVKALDDNGVLCLDVINRISFSAVGDAQSLESTGTVKGSSVVELCND